MKKENVIYRNIFVTVFSILNMATFFIMNGLLLFHYLAKFYDYGVAISMAMIFVSNIFIFFMYFVSNEMKILLTLVKNMQVLNEKDKRNKNVLMNKIRLDSFFSIISLSLIIYVLMNQLSITYFFVVMIASMLLLIFELKETYRFLYKMEYYNSKTLSKSLAFKFVSY